MKRLAVFCASNSSNNPLYASTTQELSKFLGKKRVGIVYGGSSSGLMGALAEAAIAERCEIIGVLPKFMRLTEPAHNGLTELYLVNSMHERKMKMFELCDGVIALPGGFGTLEQLFEVITWAQLGFHNKPIGVLNVNGYYDNFLSMIKTMQRDELLKKANADLVIHSNNIEELFEKMENFLPVVSALRMEKSQT